MGAVKNWKKIGVNEWKHRVRGLSSKEPRYAKLVYKGHPDNKYYTVLGYGDREYRDFINGSSTKELARRRLVSSLRRLG